MGTAAKTLGATEEDLVCTEEVEDFTYEHVHEQVLERHFEVFQFGS